MMASDNDCATPSFFDAPVFSNLEKEFFRFLKEQNAHDHVALAGALLCNRIADGDTCLELDKISGKTLADLLQNGSFDNSLNYKLPEFQQWLSVLSNSPFVGYAGEHKPLILHHNRLYLYRYWRYERNLAQNIQMRLSRSELHCDEAFLKRKLSHYFPDHPDGSINYQRVAALRALTSNFTVISGGPGTGKTSTVAKILAILLENSEREISIVLAAPTGKAAARMKESIDQALSSSGMLSDLPDAVKSKFPKEASTIHRLLGPLPASPKFRHNFENPLRCDIVVIDESSMVDLALMAKLFEAIPINTKVILLGDRDQLASVEAGSVLGDICGSHKDQSGFSDAFVSLVERICGYSLPMHTNAHPLRDAVIFLNKSYRFREGIAALATDINSGKMDAIHENLVSNAYSNVLIHPIKSKQDIVDRIQALVQSGTWDFLANDDIALALKKLFNIIVLCAHRHGPWGSETISAIIEREMKLRFGEQYQWQGLYHGKPIMITQNNYELNLFNGDIGIVRRDSSTNQLLAYFPGATEDSHRTVSVFRLPEFSSAHAFTVHKSQGSEFNTVIFIMPPEMTPVLSRELLYTAVTRARESLEIWGNTTIFAEATTRPVRRFSGLKAALYEINNVVDENID